MPKQQQQPTRIAWLRAYIQTLLVNQTARPHWPIRTPQRSSHRCGQRRLLLTQSRVTPERDRHLVTSFRRLHFSWYIFWSHKSVFGHHALLIRGDQDIAGGWSHIKPVPICWEKRDNLLLWRASLRNKTKSKFYLSTNRERHPTPCFHTRNGCNE